MYDNRKLDALTRARVIQEHRNTVISRVCRVDSSVIADRILDKHTVKHPVKHTGEEKVNVSRETLSACVSVSRETICMDDRVLAVECEFASLHECDKKYGKMR